MMENLDPKDANHQDGSIVLKELRLLKEAEYAEELRSRSMGTHESSSSSDDSSEDDQVKRKKPMTYEEFTTDPFGMKRQKAKNANKKKPKQHEHQNEGETAQDDASDEG